jgi:hypothetical protein
MSSQIEKNSDGIVGNTVESLNEGIVIVEPKE